MVLNVDPITKNVLSFLAGALVLFLLFRLVETQDMSHLTPDGASCKTCKNLDLV